MKKLKILLVGQPNVGKSSLLNALVGPKVTVSNYPGTTVEVTRAEKIFNKTKISFEDTPGIYSISDRSEEEKLTERALFEEKSDGAIIITDATSLERGLYLVLQVLEAQISTVLALNFIEDAEKKGIRINYKRLEKILNIPVLPLNPLTKRGIDELLNVVLKIKKKKGETFVVGYDDDIEEAIDKISSRLIKSRLPKRFVALRILEGDKDFYKYLKNKRIIEEIKKSLKNHPKVAEDISITRYGTAAFIAKEVTQIVPIEKGVKNIEEEVDKVLLHSFWGPLITILFFVVIFGLLLFFGNLIQEILLGFTENIFSSFGPRDSVLILILSQALYGLMVGISIALPYVFLFYLLLGLLEDIGILSRFIVSAERFLRKLGLPGKSFIPLCLGFGCSVPAIRATRILSCKKEKFCTASFFTCVPCSSRIAIVMGIVGYFGGISLAFSVFVTLLVSALIWAFLIKNILKPKITPLLLELPPYRKPLIKNILVKSWIRMKDFVFVVIPLLVIGGGIWALLDITGITNIIAKPLSPISWWLGLPTLTIIPLVFGFLQKDLTGAILLSVLGSEISLVLTPLQLYTFGIASTIQIPCMIALGMLIREFGFKKAVILTGTSIIYGLLFAGFLWRIISIL